MGRKKKLGKKNIKEHPFSEEISDGEERNQRYHQPRYTIKSQ
ncbi:hypothetical protein [Cytobacillus purgationiresistens]|uniref:Uncharacterized protein n=1 Tax=Cytobacillus purgationiresistens TaxID=863449 RepID=A0ABU0AE88_9BACI|nr:hypothetical protein [Cytobacillus purgationiresistens]MDQ0269561.1 hypothetical protein [Cytobacillus purgationiresistens]